MDTNIFIINSELSFADLHNQLSSTLCQVETLTKFAIDELFLEYHESHKGNYLETILFQAKVARQLYLFLIQGNVIKNNATVYSITQDTTKQIALHELTKLLFSINSLIQLANQHFFPKQKQDDKVNYLNVLEHLTQQVLDYFERILIIEPGFIVAKKNAKALAV